MSFAACTRMENPMETVVPVSLTYSTVDAAESKAAQNLNEGRFESGESVMVRISNTGAGVWTDYTFTTAASGAMTAPDPGPYYPAGAQNIDIVAYYPASAGTSFTVAADQTGDDSYKASDLMFASVTNQARQEAAVELAFTHKMAKLNVNITPGQGVSGISSLCVMNVKPTVPFNAATGEVGSASGDATAIAVSNEGAVLIPAQTIDGSLLSIVTDQGTATYSVAGKEFIAGNLYTINITVNLRAVGTTTAITGWSSDGTVTVNPMLKDRTPEGVEAIDMGNGLKWSNVNLGATTETGYGDYFAWGATTPFYVDHDAYGNKTEGYWIDGKTGYDWENYPFMSSERSNRFYITKYTFADRDERGIWYEDENDTFIGDNGDGAEHTDFASYDYIDDAARACWGAGWHTPTQAEWAWLLDNCTWEWQTDHNGITGMLVTSNVNGNAIFLPAAGFRDDSKLDSVGTLANYWSSSLYYYRYVSTAASYNACLLSFSSSGAERSHKYRYYGMPIRPVTE